MLGGSLAAQDKHAEAEPLVLSGYQGLHQREALMPYEDRPLVEDAATRIVSLYQAWGKPDKAAEWQRQNEAADLEFITDPRDTRDQVPVKARAQVPAAS